MLSLAEIFPRTSRVCPTPTRRFGHPEHRIVDAVGRYHFLTIRQLMRSLAYRSGTKRTIEKRLSWLVATNYLIGKAGYSQGPGKPPTIYVLGEQGRVYLEGQILLR